MSTVTIMVGRIAAYNPEKGRGIIKPLPNGPKVHFSRSALPADGWPPLRGQRVSYERVDEFVKCHCAVNIAYLDEA